MIIQNKVAVYQILYPFDGWAFQSKLLAAIAPLLRRDDLLLVNKYYKHTLIMLLLKRTGQPATFLLTSQRFEKTHLGQCCWYVFSTAAVFTHKVDQPQILSFLLALTPSLRLASPAPNDDRGADHGQAPAVPVTLNQHNARPSSGLNLIGVYATNFNETPYCCPWNPKAFGIEHQPGVWGTVPIIYQVPDSGQDGIFNERGTVLIGD